jgi:hypothetical protein
VNLTRKKPEPDIDLSDSRPEKPGGKNSPTPRRNAARARRSQTLKGSPVSKKEAKARTRAAYDESRAALKQTDLSKLPANERVPELVYVRDLVDSRYNLAGAMMPVAVLYFVATFATSTLARKDAQLSQSVLFLTLFWFLGMIVDSLIMSRKLEVKVRARFPGSTVKLRGYAVRRAFALKRFRRPVPREIPPANRWKTAA